MTTELTHSYPPGEDTRQVLQELAENLQLPKEEADRLYHNYLQKLQADVEVQLQKAEAAAASARQAAAATEQVAQEQKKQTEQQQQLEQYQEIFRQAIQNNLYPLAFDQGRLEQIRQLWQLSPDQVSQIEEEVRTELYGGIQSASGIDYTRLRQLLWSQAWLEADKETENVILKAFSQDMQPIDRDAILPIPCVDLLTIDQLWSRYSSDQFGFRTQYQVFLDVERRPQDFQRLLAWRGNSPLSLQGERKAYKSFTFDLSAPPGHLPSWRWCCTHLEGGYDVSDAVIEAFFLHLERCLPVMPNSPAPWESPSET